MLLKRSWTLVKSTGRRFRITAAAAVILIITIVIFLFRGGVPDQRKWVEAKKGEFFVDLVESGEVQAANYYDVKAPMIWGELQIMEMVPEGTLVKAGDVIAKFDPTFMEKELDTNQQTLQTKEAELKALDAEQESRYAELETSLKSSTLSKELADLRKEMMKYESPLQQRQSELEYQRQILMLDEEMTQLKNQKIIDAAARRSVLMSLEQSRDLVKQIERRFLELTLRAPIDGMVVYKEIGRRGSLKKVAVGDKPWPSQPIISIPDPLNMQVIARVNEVDASMVTTGDTVYLTLDAFERSRYTGTVAKVARLADKKTSESMIKDFEVTVKVIRPDSLMKPGMTAQGRIILTHYKDVVYIPIGAVFEQKDGKTVVFKRKNPTKPAPVITGKRNDRYIIVAEGLRPGEEVFLAPPGPEYYPLGRSREMERRASEIAQLKATPDSAFTAAENAFRNGGDGSNSPTPAVRERKDATESEIPRKP